MFPMPMFFNSIGGWEWLVILLLALLIFGSRLPETMRNLGRSISEFKRGMRESEEELRKADAGSHPDSNDKNLPDSSKN